MKQRHGIKMRKENKMEKNKRGAQTEKHGKRDRKEEKQEGGTK